MEMNPGTRNVINIRAPEVVFHVNKIFFIFSRLNKEVHLLLELAWV